MTEPGPHDAITDVPGIEAGHYTDRRQRHWLHGRPRTLRRHTRRLPAGRRPRHPRHRPRRSRKLDPGDPRRPPHRRQHHRPRRRRRRTPLPQGIRRRPATDARSGPVAARHGRRCLRPHDRQRGASIGRERIPRRVNRVLRTPGARHRRSRHWLHGRQGRTVRHCAQGRRRHRFADPRLRTHRRRAGRHQFRRRHRRPLDRRTGRRRSRRSAGLHVSLKPGAAQSLPRRVRRVAEIPARLQR